MISLKDFFGGVIATASQLNVGDVIFQGLLFEGEGSELGLSLPKLLKEAPTGEMSFGSDERDASVGVDDIVFSFC